MSRDALIFHKLVSVEDAIERLYRAFKESGLPRVREASLDEALGRVVAEDVYARSDYPPFDRSLVDGFAVRSIDVAGANEIEPVELRVVGRVDVGEKPLIEISEREAVEISTGAVIPRGADSVVMSEYTMRKGDRLLVFRSVYAGENISQTGSDISAGDLVIKRGSRIGPRETAVLIGSGIKRIKIYEPLRVAVFSTGNEIIPPGSDLELGKIYDINGPSLAFYLRELGLESHYYGILRDNYEEIYSNITRALEKHDIVITSGGTSAGFRDLIYKIFAELGAEILFHGLKTRPGRPTVAARLRDKILIGLPGFPLSAVMILLRVVKPVILRIYELQERRGVVKAKIPYRIEAGKGFREFIPVALVARGGELIAYPIALGSGSVMSMLLSEGFIEVREEREFVDENETVDVTLLSEEIVFPEIYFIGSHCLGVDLLFELSGLRNNKKIFVGSLGGWHAVKRGDADISGTHLLDEETREYNIHMIKRLGLENKVYLVRGYVRKIGFVVKKGNPKNIRDFKDLLRKDVVFINRNKGSGIRTLVDIRLRELLGGENIAKYVRGYTYEAKTHTAVASAVSSGRADVGIAIEAVLDIYKDLDFIPIGEEIYDFVIPRDRFDTEPIKKILGVLRSEEFKNILERTLRGYRAHRETGEIIYKPL